MLPTSAQIPASVLLFLLLIYALHLIRSGSGRFVVFACWARFMFAAFHNYTYQDAFAGLSVQALASVALFALGIMLLPWRLLLSRAIMPLYALIGAILLSAAVHRAVIPAFEPLTKFGLFGVIALHSYRVLRLQEEQRSFAAGLLIAFAPLLVFQFLSVVLGVAKYSPFDQSYNYIGGFFHEAVFSTSLVGLFIVTALVTGISRPVRAAVLALAIAGILLANYRTSTLGMLPLAAYYVVHWSGMLFERRLRPIVVITCALALVFATSSLLSLERFQQIPQVASSLGGLMKPPSEFRADEQRLFSNRVYIWSEYFYTWKASGDVDHLVGLGPESSRKYFKIRPHNSFVDSLFEYGLVGLAAFLLFVGYGFVLAFRSGAERWKLVSAHLSFLVLHLANMPFWMIEGLIGYALLWAYSMYYSRVVRAAPPAESATDQPALRPAMWSGQVAPGPAQRGQIRV
jgi:hypothetical protein